VLSGGVGGARFARGLKAALGPDELTIIGNVGDDLEVLGLAVSPDLDSILYTLAGLSDDERGWGGRARHGTRSLPRPSGAVRTGSGSVTSTSASISSAPGLCARERAFRR